MAASDSRGAGPSLCGQAARAVTARRRLRESSLPMLARLDPTTSSNSICVFPACLMLEIAIRFPAQRRWYLLLIVSLS